MRSFKLSAHASNSPRSKSGTFAQMLLSFGTCSLSCSRSAFRRSTGNAVSGYFFRHYFYFSPFFFLFFPMCHIVYSSHIKSARINFSEQMRLKFWIFKLNLQTKMHSRKEFDSDVGPICNTCKLMILLYKYFF